MLSLVFLIPRALVEVFREKKLLLAATFLAFVFLGIFLWIPVKSIPGNDLFFQISILRPRDIIFLVLLSLLTALALVMNFYLLGKKAEGTTLRMAGQLGIGGTGGLIASVFGVATCGLCIATLFGFLGSAGIFFLFEHRQAITILAIILMLISLWATSARVLDVCETCGVDSKKK